LIVFDGVVAETERLLRSKSKGSNVSKVTVRKSWNRTFQQAVPTAFSGNRQRPVRPRK
jgi:hypothetical protein